MIQEPQKKKLISKPPIKNYFPTNRERMKEYAERLIQEQNEARKKRMQEQEKKLKRKPIKPANPQFPILRTEQGKYGCKIN